MTNWSSKNKDTSFIQKYRQLDAALFKNIDNLQAVHSFGLSMYPKNIDNSMQHYPKISTTYIVALSFGSQQNKPCYTRNNITNLSGVSLTHHIIQKTLTIWFSIIQNTIKLIQHYIKYRQLTGGSERKPVIYITLSQFEAFSQNIDHLPQLILSGIPTKHNFVISITR